MNSLQHAPRILLTRPETSHSQGKQISREHTLIRDVLRNRARIGSCRVDQLQEADLLTSLREYADKERVFLLHLYSDDKVQSSPPSDDILEDFQAILQSFNQLNLIILSGTVPSWLLQTLFRSELAAVWVRRKGSLSNLKKFYKGIAKGISLHSAAHRVSALNWEVIPLGEELPNTYYENTEQPISPGLYYREGLLDRLSWQLRDPIKIKIGQGRWSLSRRKRWGLRLLLATLLLFAAILVALFVLPNMNKI